ncbi:hypothetical protein JCM17960_25050 [Magnetospira thiophila]
MKNALGWILLAAVGALGACGYVDAYEEGVADFEPLYCYHSLGKISCQREPNFRDSRQLVNYYGPHPSRYDAPEPVDVPEPKAPYPAGYYVMTPEPVPEGGTLVQVYGE